jgi:hypothetical protein
MNFQEFLKSKEACQDAQEWAKDKTIEQAIDQCHRGDWLLWLAQKLEVNKRLLVGTAGHCVNTVRHLMKDERSKNYVDVCIAYGKGEATDDELAAAWAAAAAAAWAWAAAAASDAAWAAAAAAVADAAWAAAAASDAAAVAYAKNQKQTADICREHLKKAMIEKWNK